MREADLRKWTHSGVSIECFDTVVPQIAILGSELRRSSDAAIAVL